MARRILVVEDETAIREMICFVLEQNGFQPIEAEDYDTALSFLIDPYPDLVLLDWMIPGGSGIQVIKQMKRENNTRDIPIIMLTAKGEEEDKVKGLETGADDYVIKPFSPKELVARVKAVLRRVGVLTAESGGPQTTGLSFNGWHLDTAGCQLRNPQQLKVDLTQGEYSLLLALAQNARRVLSREQLLELTRSDSVEVFDRTIDVLIMRLRRKIEINPHQPMLIKTLRGLGYVFAADVQHHDKAA